MFGKEMWENASERIPNKYEKKRNQHIIKLENIPIVVFFSFVLAFWIHSLQLLFLAVLLNTCKGQKCIFKKIFLFTSTIYLS